MRQEETPCSHLSTLPLTHPHCLPDKHCLSQTGVRARQEKMPFAIIDDPVLVHALIKPLLGQTVALDVTPDNVTLQPASSSQAAAAAAAANGGSNRGGVGAGAANRGGAGAVSKVSTARLIELLDCTPSLAGAKASACAKLEQVRGQGGVMCGVVCWGVV